MPDKLKVLNKKEIIRLLDEGNILRYATIQGKVYIQDKYWNVIGAVQFNTYLKLLPILQPIKSNSVCNDMYIKKKD